MEPASKEPTAVDGVITGWGAHTLTIPSIVPEASETVYLVLDDFGRLGRAWVETDEKHANLETIIQSVLTGQYSAPLVVAAFNLTEGWAKEVSKDVAKEVLERARLEPRDLSESVRDFVETHTGEDVTWYLQS